MNIRAKKKRADYIRICGLAFSLVCLVIVMARPWVEINGKSYTLFRFWETTRGEGMSHALYENIEEEYRYYQSQGIDMDINLEETKTELVVFSFLTKGVLIVLPLGLVLMCLLSIWKGDNHGLDAGLFVFLTAAMAGMTGMGGMAGSYLTKTYQMLLVLLFLNYLINRLLCSIANGEYTTKEQHKQEIEENKRIRERKKFPGRYSTLFYGIIKKNILGNRKNYLLMFLSLIFCEASLSFVYIMKYVLGLTHSEERITWIGEGFSGMILEMLLIIVIVQILYLSSVFFSYAKQRMRDYSLLVILGIRRKTFLLIIALEYAIGICLAVPIGMAAGRLVAKGIVAAENLAGSLQMQIPLSCEGQALLTYLAIVLFSLAINWELASGFRLERTLTLNIQEEKLPKRIIKLRCLAGICMMAAGIYMFNQRIKAESVLIQALFWAGYMILLTAAGAVLYRKYIRSDKMGKLLQKKTFRYRYRTNMKKILTFTLLDFLVLYPFLIQSLTVKIAEPAEGMFPYDFVCLAHGDKDSDIFDSLSEKYEIQEMSFPMVRVTTTDGDEAPEDIYGALGERSEALYLQGQHIGISETTYRELKKAKGQKVTGEKRLAGEKIGIVFQQDRSVKVHPLDWYIDRERPNLRIGQPVTDYDLFNREKVFPPYTVEFEETDCLLGMFAQGQQEDVVVFSDEYFAKLEKNKEKMTEEIMPLVKKCYGETAIGPDMLYIIQCKDEDYESIAQELKVLSERNKADSHYDSFIKSFYGRKEYTKNVAAEREMKDVLSVNLVVMLAVTMLFQFWVQMTFQFNQEKDKYKLLKWIGMNSRERKRLLRRETFFYLWFSYVIAAGVAEIYLVIVCGLRRIPLEQAIRLNVWWAVAAAAFFLLQVSLYAIIYKNSAGFLGVKDDY